MPMRMSKKKRAKVTRRVTVGVAAGTAVGLAVAGAATAARRTEQPIPKLPAPGATVEVDLLSKGVELAFAGQKINTGALAGKAIFEIEANEGDPSSVRTKISEFYLTSPGPKGGVTISVAANARDIREQSELRLVKPTSPRFQHSLELALNITVRHPEILGLPAATDEPLSLTAKEPAKLYGKLAAFPAKGAVYKLDGPTPLTVPGRPDADVASLLKFPVRLEGL
jgi:hypothetical protein